MLKNKSFMQLAFAASVMLISSGVLSAPPATPDGVINFSPLDLTDDAGAKVKQSVFTYQGQAYEVQLDGLGVGGAKGNGVKVMGEVYGLKNVTDLEDIYVTDLAQDTRGTVSSETLWLYSRRGVSIYLQTNNPQLSLAAGGNAVTVTLPQFDTSGKSSLLR
jgi:hypothetical protein